VHISGDPPLPPTPHLGYNAVALQEASFALSLPNLTSIILYWKPVSIFSDASLLGVPRIRTLVAATAACHRCLQARSRR
jgi:hypothetical protein